MTDISTPTASPSIYRWFAILTGLTSLSIFVQAIVAGLFVSQSHRNSWIDVHGIVANVVVVLALATAIFAIVTLRRVLRSVMWGSAVLFVLVVIQVVLGHLITDASLDGLIAVHVPLAFVVFGLSGWLAAQSAIARRRAGAIAKA